MTVSGAKETRKKRKSRQQKTGLETGDWRRETREEKGTEGRKGEQERLQGENMDVV